LSLQSNGNCLTDWSGLDLKRWLSGPRFLCFFFSNSAGELHVISLR
jgi:hypothetical protein